METIVMMDKMGMMKAAKMEVIAGKVMRMEVMEKKILKMEIKSIHKMNLQDRKKKLLKKNVMENLIAYNAVDQMAK